MLAWIHKGNLNDAYKTAWATIEGSRWIRLFCKNVHTWYGEPSGPSMNTFHSYKLDSSASVTVIPAGGDSVSSASSWKKDTKLDDYLRGKLMGCQLRTLAMRFWLPMFIDFNL